MQWRIIKYAPMFMTMLSACASHNIDTEEDPVLQAQTLTTQTEPEEIAHTLVMWLADTDTTNRRFARILSMRILDYYDSIGHSDSASRFVTTFDVQRKRLSADKHAHLMLVLTSPATLATHLVRSKASKELIDATIRQLEDNRPALETFRNTYEKTSKILQYEDNDSIQLLD